VLSPGVEGRVHPLMMIPAGRITKRAFVTVCALAVLALAAAGPASAFTNWPAGTVTAVDDGRGFDIGGLTTCNASFRGHLLWDAGMWYGGQIAVDELAFANCTGGARVSANAVSQRAWGIDGTLSTVLYGIDIDVTTPNGTCRYTGTMYGFHYLDRTHHSGPLYRQGGGCGGGSSEQGRVSLLVRDANGKPPAV
jgi:hypothetical protein